MANPLSIDEIKSIVKEVVSELLKDPIKTINRTYEDREILIDVKTRLGTIEDSFKEVVGRVRKLEKNLTEDISDTQDDLNEIKELMGGE